MPSIAEEQYAIRNLISFKWYELSHSNEILSDDWPKERRWIYRYPDGSYIIDLLEFRGSMAFLMSPYVSLSRIRREYYNYRGELIGFTSIVCPDCGRQLKLHSDEQCIYCRNGGNKENNDCILDPRDPNNLDIHSLDEDELNLIRRIHSLNANLKKLRSREKSDDPFSRSSK